MVAQLVAGEALAAQVTLGRHFRGSLFHSQIADAVVFVDFTATVRASGCLIPDTSISQQMVETGCTHEVSIAALKTNGRKRPHCILLPMLCTMYVQQFTERVNQTSLTFFLLKDELTL